MHTLYQNALRFQGDVVNCEKISFVTNLPNLKLRQIQKSKPQWFKLSISSKTISLSKNFLFRDFLVTDYYKEMR